MANRTRVRVGREVTYLPTDGEAGGISDPGGWVAKIVNVNVDGSVDLHVVKGDGTSMAKTLVHRGAQQGNYSILPPTGVSVAHPAIP
jgi:hypothetical protein